MPFDSIRTKAAFWVGVVFVLGIALGGVGGYALAHRAYAASAAMPVSDAAKRAQKMEQLTQDLSLSDDQRQKVDGIISDVQGTIKGIKKVSEPQIDAARHAGRDRIRKVLTPEQLPKFEDYISKLDESRKHNNE